jgi:hypothetical protein
MHEINPMKARVTQGAKEIIQKYDYGWSFKIWNFLMVGLLSWSVVGTAAKNSKPLKVFLLVGQSNMQGHAHIRTFDHIGMDSKTASILQEMQNEDGRTKICENVWISYLSTEGIKQGQLSAGFGASDEKIGPEFTFGIYMQKQLNEPILIIKTAWGGKSLHTDFRSPSAGPYTFNTSQLATFEKQGKDMNLVRAAKDKATGHYYRLMIGHVQKVLSNIKSVYPNYQSEHGYELAGMVWFQGWNDMVDRGVYPERDQSGGYDHYTHTLGHFMRDVRAALSTPELPIVIGVFGVGGPVATYLPSQQRYAGIHQNFRDAMAAPAGWSEFNGNVANVHTEDYWDLELVALRAKDGEINQTVKRLISEGGISKSEQSATRAKLRAEMFTPRELETMQKGVSNQEYHYLGAAKIIAQIGKGFAESMTLLLQQSSR